MVICSMRRTPIAWKYFNTLKIVAINWPNCKAWSTGILNTGTDYIKTEQIEYLREPRIMSWTSSVSLEQVKVKNEISLELWCVYVASCRPEFESQANHPCFLSFLVKIELFICLCGVKRTKINRKRPYLAHIKNDYKDIYRNVKAANFECLQSSVTRCWSKKVDQRFPKVV